jgi:hypothetical protein
MDPAVTGLIGVIVGAVVTGGISFYLAWRNERSQLRAALRLLCTDLYKVSAVTHDLRTAGVWGAERGPLPTRAFDAYDATLARALRPATWKRVEGSVLGVLRLEGIRVSMLEADRAATADEQADAIRICAFIDAALVELDGEAWAIDRSDRPQQSRVGAEI